MNTLLALARKLRRMPVGEIIGRSVSRIKANQERATYHRSGASVVCASIGEISEGSLLRLRDLLLRGACANDFSRFHSQFPLEYDRLVLDTARRARKVVASPFEQLGVSVDVTTHGDWHVDPKTGYSFPRRYHGDVAIYELNGDVDVKHVWELNRHQFLVDLALGWRCIADEAMAVRARDLLLSWIDDNKPLQGVNWTSALEVAVRSISWLWTLAALADWRGWKPGELVRVYESLYHHAQYLTSHFSHYSSPYNHLIGEATALYMLSHALDETQVSEKWRKTASQLLCDHGPRQFYSDGFSVEQATGYHYFTLGFLTLAYVLAPESSTLRRTLEPTLKAAYTAGAAMRQPDGRWPCIGDVDGARSIPVHHDDFWAFQSVSSLGAVLFGIEECKDEQAGPGAEVYWLAGTSGIEKWRAFGSKRPGQLTLLPKSGYAIGRSIDDSGDWFLLDSGPIAAGLYADSTPSVAHGHNDILQVLYSFGGRPVLEDSGMLRYAGDRMWVDGFRSAAAHSTIAIDGLPMAREAGRLGWSHVREPQSITGVGHQGAIVASGGVNFGTIGHVARHLLFIPSEGIWIADVVTLNDTRRIRWYWQLASGLVPKIRSGCEWPIVVSLDESLSMNVWSGDFPVKVELHAAAPNSPLGWRSTCYGMRIPASCVAFSVGAECSFATVTAFGRNLRSVMFQSLESSIICTRSDASTDFRPPIPKSTGSASWLVGNGTQWCRLQDS